MYQVLFRVKTKARTFNGINRAIERETGVKKYYSSAFEMCSAEAHDFLVLHKNYLEIWGDIG